MRELWSEGRYSLDHPEGPDVRIGKGDDVGGDRVRGVALLDIF